MCKKVLLIFVISLVGLVILFSTRTKEKEKELIVIKSEPSIRGLTIDQKIAEAELIVIGKVNAVLPSKWKSPANGKVPEDITAKEIFDAKLSIFTDTLISIEQSLKGTTDKPVVRVRSFKGEVDNVRFENSIEPSYKHDQLYLLFLLKDFGQTQIVDPGDYIPVNSIDSVYEVIDDKAISADDEWVLEELIAYIQNSVSQTP